VGIRFLNAKWERTDTSDSKNLGIEWEAAELDRLLAWVEPLCVGAKQVPGERGGVRGVWGEGWGT